MAHFAPSPLGLQYSRIRSVEINKLIDTARFTHKYRLESFETWARQAIGQVCGRRDGAIFKACAPDLYVQLLELDVLCPLPGVKALIRKLWAKRLRDNDPALRLAEALDMAEATGFRDLLGDLYYLQLQRLDDPAADIPINQAAPALPADLSDVHQLRLLMGYRSLSLCWRRISANPPTPILTECPHGTYCATIWHEFWVQEVKTLPEGADPVEKLQELRRSLPIALSGYACLPVSVEKTIPNFIKTLRASMADHFLGPPTAS